MRLHLAALIFALLFASLGVNGAFAEDKPADLKKDSSIGATDVSAERAKLFLNNEFLAKTGKFAFDGFVQLKYVGIQSESYGNTQALRTSLNFNLENMGTRGLAFHFYGMMQNGLQSGADAVEDLDLYYAYLQYKTFQNALDVQLGRFEKINNTFMTVDGGQLSYVTPYYFGVTAYAGIPFFKDYENKREVFRNVGDLAYGARVFLSGIKNTQAFISYDRETGEGIEKSYTVLREAIGIGGGYFYDLTRGGKASNVSVKALMDYDPYNSLLSRGSLKVNYNYDFFELMLFGDYFDIKDQYPAGRELVIRLFSTGLESRVGGDVSFRPIDWFTIYGGTYFSNVQLNSGSAQGAMVYRVGFDMYLIKQIGLILAGEFYAYDTRGAVSLGGSLSGEWRITNYLSFLLSGEYATVDMSNLNLGTGDAYSVEGELKLYLTRTLALSGFFEKGSNNRFVDDMRYGVMVRYDFFN